MPRLLVGEWLMLQSDISLGDIERSTGDLLALGDRLTILISLLGMMVYLLLALLMLLSV